ncbi:MAG: hypothetical protein PHW56_06045 [Methanosarcinaceae archaeon]|nr:hypothetical protein [Methanosarcinaceae archaeon]
MLLEEYLQNTGGIPDGYYSNITLITLYYPPHPQKHKRALKNYLKPERKINKQKENQTKNLWL